MKNDIWKIVTRLARKSMIGSKWLYKVNHETNGNVEKYTMMFIAIRFSEKEGVDYKETYAPMARHTSIKTIMV